MPLLWFPFQVSLGWCLNKISTHTRHVLVLPQLIINSNDDNHGRSFWDWFIFCVASKDHFFPLFNYWGEAQLRHPQTSLTAFYVAVNKKNRAHSRNLLFGQKIWSVLNAATMLQLVLRAPSSLFPTRLSSCPQLNPSLPSGYMDGKRCLSEANRPSLRYSP